MGGARNLIYLVEDDEAQAKYLELVLNGFGFDVGIFSTGDRVMRAIQRILPDIVLLDRRLPDIDGLRVLAWIRHSYSRLPVIMLTNAVHERDLVEAFEAGVDDYMVKPIKEVELLARIRAQLRRAKQVLDSQLESLKVGSYVVRSTERAVYKRSGERINLTPKEFEIFLILARNIGSIVPRDTVLSLVWGQSTEAQNSRSLDTHIYRLRRRLNLCPDGGVLLRVVYSQGYRLEYISSEPSEFLGK
ncbi:response regulator transcription factor [Cupriavidus sp. H39]|uniref:response regulator transcription factor n=1 Tax=Cupriavidus sp. H39 TaxID=3401635 RepID=UPI003CFBDC84